MKIEINEIKIENNHNNNSRYIFGFFDAYKLEFEDGTVYSISNPLITFPLNCANKGSIIGMVLGFVIGGAAPVYFTINVIMYLLKEFIKEFGI